MRIRGGFAPYGYRYVDRMCVEDEQEQDCIRQVKSLAAGGYTIDVIVHAINTSGYRNRAGSPFIESQVRRILKPKRRERKDPLHPITLRFTAGELEALHAAADTTGKRYERLAAWMRNRLLEFADQADRAAHEQEKLALEAAKREEERQRLLGEHRDITETAFGRKLMPEEEERLEKLTAEIEAPPPPPPEPPPESNVEELARQMASGEVLPPPEPERPFVLRRKPVNDSRPATPEEVRAGVEALRGKFST